MRTSTWLSYRYDPGHGRPALVAEIRVLDHWSERLRRLVSGLEPLIGVGGYDRIDADHPLMDALPVASTHGWEPHSQHSRRSGVVEVR